MTFMFFGTFQTARRRISVYVPVGGTSSLIRHEARNSSSSSSWFYHHHHGFYYNATPEATPNHAVVKNFGMLEMKLENS